MGRIKEKKERALGTKLFLKPDRCNSHKCVMVRRPYKPGQHGQKRKRGKLSEFGRQLQEKQKIQIVYGLTNGQMRKIFKEHAGDPSSIVKTLESRLDRVVFLLGIASSSIMARQMVSHGHIFVNGRKVTIPSYKVTEGDEIEIRPQSRKSVLFEDLSKRLEKHETPEWLKIDKDKEKGTCLGKPPEDSISSFDINMVGEFYNR